MQVPRMSPAVGALTSQRVFGSINAHSAIVWAAALVFPAPRPAIINLRLPTEQGADIERHADVAKSVGLPYYSIPFSASAPDPAVVDQFLKTIQTPGVQPAFVH